MPKYLELTCPEVPFRHTGIDAYKKPELTRETLFDTIGLISGNPGRFVFSFFKEEETFLDVKIGDRSVAKVKTKFANLYHEIEKSRSILELKDNWDGEGAIGYSEETWIKSVKFLVTIYNFSNRVSSFAVPKIYNGPDGSIDIQWINEEFELLVNVAPDIGDVTFYMETVGSSHTMKYEGEDSASHPERLIKNLNTIL